jgi:hypothetical protein
MQVLFSGQRCQINERVFLGENRAPWIGPAGRMLNDEAVYRGWSQDDTMDDERRQSDAVLNGEN